MTLTAHYPQYWAIFPIYSPRISKILRIRAFIIVVNIDDYIVSELNCGITVVLLDMFSVARKGDDYSPNLDTLKKHTILLPKLYDPAHSTHQFDNVKLDLLKFALQNFRFESDISVLIFVTLHPNKRPIRAELAHIFSTAIYGNKNGRTTIHSGW